MDRLVTKNKNHSVWTNQQTYKFVTKIRVVGEPLFITTSSLFFTKLEDHIHGFSQVESHVLILDPRAHFIKMGLKPLGRNVEVLTLSQESNIADESSNVYY